MAHQSDMKIKNQRRRQNPAGIQRSGIEKTAGVLKGSPKVGKDCQDQARGSTRKSSLPQVGRSSVFCNLSLAPGFSPVLAVSMVSEPFQRLIVCSLGGRSQTVETVSLSSPSITRLKPGANEMAVPCKTLRCARARRNLLF
jgi:hypothetical protein